MQDRFYNKADFFITLTLLFYLSFEVFYLSPSLSRNPAKSSLSLGVSIVVVCLYRIVKHLMSFVIKLNLPIRLLLAVIVHTTLLLFYNLALHLYGSILIGKYLFGAILAFIVIASLEIYYNNK